MIDLTPDWSLLVILAIFIANYFVVRHFLFRPINRILVEREEEMHSAEAIYEESMARFNEATHEMETRLQEARRRGAEVREARRAEAAARRNELIDKTRAEADGIVGSAETEMQRELATAREKILREADALARLAAEKILGRNIA